MSSSQTTAAADNLYAASVNPPRRAKLQAAASLLPALLPSPPSTIPTSSSFSVSTISQSSETVQPKKKRGRKPASGGSSRAAREAARKANHSRIEKARRGKINNALQELKMLIPADFAASAREGEEDDDDDSEEDFPVSPTGPSKKESGKKSSSEREFKLDILERTVLFVRALLKRLDEHERSTIAEGGKQASRCQCHSSPKEGTTRKRKADEQEDKEPMKKHRAATPARSDQDDASDGEDDDVRSCTDSDNDNDATEEASPLSLPSASKNSVRLPSISELLSSSFGIGSAHAPTQQLPSPSLSPHFSPHFRSTDGKKAHFSLSLSPPVPQLSVPRSTSVERAERTYESQDVKLDSRLSCPVGMSYLLTPPSADPSTKSNQGSQAPVFRLPSSALASRDAASGMKVHGVEIENCSDTEEGGARTATLALLQMRGTGYSRAGASGSGSAVDGKAVGVARTSLTPGGLLGIRTGERL